MDSKETKQQVILTAALKLFSARGYAGTSIADIMKDSDAAKGTVYYFFDSKEAIYRAVWNENFPELQLLIRNASVYLPNPENYDRDVFPVLVRVMQSFLIFSRNHPDFTRLLLTATFIPPESSGAAIAQKNVIALQEILTEMFFAMSNTHGNMRGNEEQLAQTFFFLTITTAGSQIIARKAFQEDHLKILVKHFMHGIFS